MSSPQEKVLEMVAAGKISAAEGDGLLKAMTSPRAGLWRVLFIPAERFGGLAGVTVGGFALLGALVLSRYGVHFDGAMDVHVSRQPVALPFALLEAFFAWPFLAAVLWATARVAKRPGRFLDFLGAVGLARVLFDGMGLLSLASRSWFPKQVVPGQLPPPEQIAFGFALLPLVAWGIALLVTGFRTASGARSGRLALSSIGGLVAAEVLSKVILFLVQR